MRIRSFFVIALFLFMFVPINVGARQVEGVDGSSGSLSDDTSYHNYNSASLVSCGSDMIKDMPSIIPKITRRIYTIIEVAVPILLVVFGSLDLIKAVYAQKDDEIKKGQKILISRIIIGVVIFFVFVLVKAVVGMVADEGDSVKIVECLDCFIGGECSS